MSFLITVKVNINFTSRHASVRTRIFIGDNMRREGNSSAVGSGGLFRGGDKKFQVSKPTKLTKLILSLSSIPRYGTQKSCLPKNFDNKIFARFPFC